MQIYNGEKERNRKHPDPNCKHCRGVGWAKRLIPAVKRKAVAIKRDENGEDIEAEAEVYVQGQYGLCVDPSYGSEFFPCGCCDVPKGYPKGHEVYNGLVGSPHYVWDEALLGFRPDDGWIGGSQAPPAREIDAVKALFAEKPQRAGAGMERMFGGAGSL
jgi:hypothetical protein